MRNVALRNMVVGSFLGFVLGAAFLAACGSGGDGTSPAPVVVPGEVVWTPLEAGESITTSATLGSGDVWTSTTSYDNSSADRRNQLAAVEVVLNVSPDMSGNATVEVGILPAPDGTRFATDPQWLGSAFVAMSGSRRAVLSGLPIPPMPLKFALRVQGLGGATARVSALNLFPYGEVMP
jgi:hypothetical protein